MQQISTKQIFKKSCEVIKHSVEINWCIEIVLKSYLSFQAPNICLSWCIAGCIQCPTKRMKLYALE